MPKPLPKDFNFKLTNPPRVIEDLSLVKDVNEYDGRGLTRLTQATKDNNITVASRLIELGADVNLPCIKAVRSIHDGLTPLHLSAALSSLEMMILLIDNGAKVDLMSDEGTSPLNYASSVGLRDEAELLIIKGANVNLIGGVGSLTPLMSAAYNGENEIIKLLLDNGADHTIVDSGNNTAYDLAMSASHIKTANHLVAYAKEINAKKEHASLMDAINQTPNHFSNPDNNTNSKRMRL